MADVLVRLDVQSEAYESKLKNATANLQHMEKEVRRVGATFEVADKEDLEFIKSLGSMETKADNASGKIKEMTQSIAEMSMVYSHMTEAEKKAAPGQALAASIAQQKGNLAEFKDALADASGEAQKTGGFIDTLADGLGQLGPVGQMAGKLLKGAFGPVGIAIGVVVGAIHQVVEAFKRNEDAMAGATRAAAPFKAIWQQIQRLFDRLVPYIAEGMEKISNGMQSLFGKITDWMGKLSNTALGKKLGLDKVYEQLKQVSAAQAELTESNKKIADTENALNKMRRDTKTANTNRSAQISELRYKASNKTDYSAEDRVEFLEQAQKLEGQTLQANLALRQKEYELIKLKNSLTQSGQEDLDAENDALNAVTEARIQYNDHLRATQKALETARKEAEAEADAAKETASTSGDFNPSGPQKTKFEELQQSVSIKLADDATSVDMSSLRNLLGVALQNEIDALNPDFEKVYQKMLNGDNIPDTEWEKLAEQINEKLAELNIEPIEIDVKTGGIKTLQKEVEGTIDHVNGAASAFSALGNAMGQIEDPGAKVAGMVAEAIGSVVAGYGAATAQAASMGPWAWIAFAVTGLATMIATIASIKQATAGSYAEGGLVPGSSYSGDNLTANVNSGELILNRAQQANIAGQLQNSNPMGNLRLSTEISGSNLRVVLNNDNRSRGGSRDVYGVR